MPESTTYPGFTLERVHIDSIKVGDSYKAGRELVRLAVPPKHRAEKPQSLHINKE